MKIGPLVIAWNRKPKAKADPAPAVKIADPIQHMRRLARAAANPCADGRMPHGHIGGMFGEHVVLLFDEYGRAFQIHGGLITGAHFMRVGAPRSEIEKLFERFGTVDFDPSITPEIDR